VERDLRARWITALPPDIRAFGDFTAIVFGEADPPFLANE
jgi:hypothetical protein